MKIAQLAPPFVRVPPERYGGCELVVSNLAEELVRRGHEVTLFASGDSRTSARLVPIAERALWDNADKPEPVAHLLIAVGRCYAMAEEFDLIHNHLDSFAYPGARASATPTLTTLHGRLDLPHLQPLYAEFRDMALVSISDAQRRPLPRARWLRTVPNGIDVRAHRFGAGHGGYLAFLGRFTPDKGFHTAVEIARRAGMKLKVAGRLPLANSDDPMTVEDRRYFEDMVRPLLAEPFVEYVGEADLDLKCELLGGAAALLFPVEWPEPFGLVMAEAMACGAPVLATRWGSVPEVVAEGETGFIRDTPEEMVAALERLGEIDRRACRRRAAQLFSVEAMADGYEAAYRALLDRRARLVA
jgi:glycosyltransferase involved in cell wall biosynthesis